MSVDLEKLLRPVDTPVPPFPPKFMQLASGELMVVRQVGREEIPAILPHIEPLLHVERDYYDIVSARVYAELLAYYRHRVQDEYVLVAQIDGELAAIEDKDVSPQRKSVLDRIKEFFTGSGHEGARQAEQPASGGK